MFFFAAGRKEGEKEKEKESQSSAEGEQPGAPSESEAATSAAAPAVSTTARQVLKHLLSFTFDPDRSEFSTTVFELLSHLLAVFLNAECARGRRMRVHFPDSDLLCFAQLPKADV